MRHCVSRSRATGNTSLMLRLHNGQETSAFRCKKDAHRAQIVIAAAISAPAIDADRRKSPKTGGYVACSIANADNLYVCA